MAYIRILKFGGTSVGDAAAFERAVQIVRENQSSLVVVVVSAMSGVTDALIRSTTTAASNGSAVESEQAPRSCYPAPQPEWQAPAIA